MRIVAKLETKDQDMSETISHDLVPSPTHHFTNSWLKHEHSLDGTIMNKLGVQIGTRKQDGLLCYHLHYSRATVDRPVIDIVIQFTAYVCLLTRYRRQGTSSSNTDHHLANVLLAMEVFKCLGRLLELEDPVDYGVNLVGLEQKVEPLE